MASELVLVTGGRRSGKSAFAARLATELAGTRHVLFVATALPNPDDEPMTRRIAQHRDARPRDWVTLEPGPGLAEAVATPGGHGAVLLDSVTLWVSGLTEAGWDGPAHGLTAECRGGTAKLLAAARTCGRPVVIVTDEVGSGVAPATEIGNAFADALGEVNQLIAAESDRVYLVVSGAPVRLK
jgi:adenosylcobinamide kinase/adenosylcobinamide-phosphate guanylyltransferase